MKEPDSAAASENRLRETGASRSSGADTGRVGRQPDQPATEPNPLKFVVRAAPRAEPAVSPPTEPAPGTVEEPRLESPGTSPQSSPQRAEGTVIPARMMNEFVYCQRLFYYEFVEGVFVESVDTLRGGAIHKRVDSGNGSLPAAKTRKKQSKPADEGKTSETAEDQPKVADAESNKPETIHSRSVQMGSDRLGIVAKMDLVEVRAGRAMSAAQSMSADADNSVDLFSALEVCPVDYKAGAPKEGEEVNELWDTDKMQLGLQALILRDNGYICNEGIIYYRATKQRVRLPITSELENWIRQNIADARHVVTRPIANGLHWFFSLDIELWQSHPKALHEVVGKMAVAIATAAAP